MPDEVYFDDEESRPEEVVPVALTSSPAVQTVIPVGTPVIPDAEVMSWWGMEGWDKHIGGCCDTKDAGALCCVSSMLCGPCVFSSVRRNSQSRRPAAASADRNSPAPGNGGGTVRSVRVRHALHGLVLLRVADARVRLRVVPPRRCP
jgi:hypothetical protein